MGNQQPEVRTWTGNKDVDAAIVMLCLIDCELEDDERVDAVEDTLRRLYARNQELEASLQKLTSDYEAVGAGGVSAQRGRQANSRGLHQISEDDLEVYIFRPDIQSKDSVVRLTHKPTGIWAQCGASRNNAENEELAFIQLERMLRDRLMAQAQEPTATLEVKAINPLTDEQLSEIAKEHTRSVGCYNCYEQAIPDRHNRIEDFARAIERAHGIGATPCN